MRAALSFATVLSCTWVVLTEADVEGCKPSSSCKEDINCPDVPEKAGRSFEDVFSTECETRVSELWSGAPKLKLGKLCPCSCDAMSKCSAPEQPKQTQPPPPPPRPPQESTPKVPIMDGNFQTVERVALGKDPVEASRVFAEYFEQRKPIIITDAISRKLKKNWGLSNQRKKFGKKTIIVTAQPPSWKDTRHTNFHAIHDYIKTNTDVGVGWGKLLDAVALPTEEGQSVPRTADVAQKLGESEFWRQKGKDNVQIDWETTELYVRSNVPFDHKGDDLGPVLDPLTSVPPLILDALAAGSFLPRPSISKHNISKVLRVGTAGTYYPAHFDCFPNLLQNFVGTKELFLFDQLGAWRDLAPKDPAAFEKLSHLLNIQQAGLSLGTDEEPSYAEYLRGRLYKAEMKPGDTLWVPVFMLHEVVVTEGSLGLNTCERTHKQSHIHQSPWYEAFEYPDTVACTELKMQHPMTWKTTQMLVDYIAGHGVKL